MSIAKIHEVNLHMTYDIKKAWKDFLRHSWVYYYRNAYRKSTRQEGHKKHAEVTRHH